jgi:hypothetical protein
MAMITIIDIAIMLLIGIYGSILVIFILRNWGDNDEE